MARSELTLSPLTWSASASLSDKFWENDTAELSDWGMAFAATAKRTSTAFTSSLLNS